MHVLVDKLRKITKAEDEAAGKDKVWAFNVLLAEDAFMSLIMVGWRVFGGLLSAPSYRVGRAYYQNAYVSAALAEEIYDALAGYPELQGVLAPKKIAITGITQTPEVAWRHFPSAVQNLEEKKESGNGL